MVTPTGERVDVRPAARRDLDRINGVVMAAISTWRVPDRVKRLVRPIYRYTPIDLKFMTMRLAENENGIVGVVCWEPYHELCKRSLLLHGLYVSPASQGNGIGTRLLGEVNRAAMVDGFDGVLVRANREAKGFFGKRGLGELPVESRQYPYRFWMMALPEAG